MAKPKRDEAQLLARDAADPERATLTELRRTHGRDLAAWPVEDRERYERWEAAQLARKAERDAGRPREPVLPEPAPEPEPPKGKRVRRG